MKRKLIYLVSASLIAASQIAAQSEKDKPAENVQKDKVKTFEAGEIVISGKKIPAIDKASTQSIISSKDIDAHNDKNLSDTLQLVPGMTTYQHGKGHIRYRMRGFEMPYVALLVDGIPVSDVYEANVDISKIPVLNASEIVINRGTCSALYGTMGSVGSINIITKKPVELYAKGSAEYGSNGDFTFNGAHGNSIGGFYYWLTGTIERQAPYEVSGKLTKSERRKWVNKFMPDSGLGYTTDLSGTAADTYINDTGDWPHQEMFKYGISGKTGYEINDDIEAGISSNFNYSTADRYSVSLSNTEEFSKHTWPGTNPTMSLSSNSFSWKKIYSVNAAPYIQIRGEKMRLKTNVFYTHNYEYLDGYQDEDETIPVKGWGGAHSNWQNTSVGFNIFPSYSLTEWNTVNTSILFRWDKHLERVQADSEFIGEGASGGGADAAFALAGNSWFDTKLMEGKQITVAVEDEIDFYELAQIPVELSVGVSYDAQKLSKFKARSQIMAMGRVTQYGDSMEDQYIADSDSKIWGTRDSFSPVLGATYEPVKDFLLLRSSISQKTKLPTMSQYANVYEDTDEGLKPEKSLNLNTGFQLFFIQKTVSFRTDYFYSKFKDKLATIYDVDTPSVKKYTNIKGETHQGIELIVDGTFASIADLVDLSSSFSYTYLHVRNLDTGEDDSTINKGEKIADIPEHQLTLDIRFDFKTKTSVDIFGSYTANAVKYAMKSNPSSTDEFSTDYYKTVKLHDPLMLSMKISQKFLDHYEGYVMCKNILDDYAADPFNPGPGRTFYFGMKGEL